MAQFSPPPSLKLFTKSAEQITTSSGTLTRLDPMNSAAQTVATTKYCAVFPGFTGDALTHKPFIKSALEQGIGVLCVTPTWVTSTRMLRSRSLDLLNHTKGLAITPKDIHFIRAVSFGAQLSLVWLSQELSPDKIAWITPCSADHLKVASIKMQIDIVHNDDWIPTISTQTPTRILTLPRDPVVPTTDPIFVKVAPRAELMTINGEDHFTAGDLPEASIQIARWFAAEGAS